MSHQTDQGSEERRAIRERLQIVADALRSDGITVTDIELNVAATTTEALTAFAARYGQSAEWLATGNLWPLIVAMYRAKTAS